MHYTHNKSIYIKICIYVVHILVMFVLSENHFFNEKKVTLSRFLQLQHHMLASSGLKIFNIQKIHDHTVQLLMLMLTFSIILFHSPINKKITLDVSNISIPGLFRPPHTNRDSSVHFSKENLCN